MSHLNTYFSSLHICNQLLKPDNQPINATYHLISYPPIMVPDNSFSKIYKTSTLIQSLSDILSEQIPELSTLSRLVVILFNINSAHHHIFKLLSLQYSLHTILRLSPSVIPNYIQHHYHNYLKYLIGTLYNNTSHRMDLVFAILNKIGRLKITTT